MEQKILSTTSSLFSLMGIQQLRMVDLAQHMGVSKKTLYRFFPSREQLVVRVVAEMGESLTNQLREVSLSETNTLKQLTSYITTMATFYKKWSPVFFADLQKHYPSLWTSISTEVRQLLLNLLRRNLESGIQQGIYRGNIHPGLLVTLWQQHFYNDFRYCEQLSTDYSKEEVFRQSCLLFLYGIILPSKIPALEKLMLDYQLQANQSTSFYTPQYINQAIV